MAETGSSSEKKKKDRSAAYPSVSLPDAVEHLKKIHGDLGKGPYDRDSAAKSLGYNGVSGASASKIAALVHYGLIQRLGGGYMETDLGTRIALPVDLDEEKRALIEAFKSPTLFSKLLFDFGGKSLPAKLEIILVRQYRITEQASKDATKSFRESAEYVGILKNGFLSDTEDAGESLDEVSSMAREDTEKSSTHINQSSSPEPTTGSAPDISISIGKGLRVVFSQNLMLDVAAGRFSLGIGQLTRDLSAISKSDQELHDKSGASISDEHE